MKYKAPDTVTKMENHRYKGHGGLALRNRVEKEDRREVAASTWYPWMMMINGYRVGTQEVTKDAFPLPKHDYSAVCGSGGICSGGGA